MKLSLLILVLTFATLSAHAQGTFQNLNFEQANPVSAGDPDNPNAVTPASALPGWSGSIDGTPVTEVLFNDITIGAASIDILGPGWNFNNPGIIDGNYTVFLQTFISSEGEVSLSQNGTVPANAESLQFSAWSQYSPANLSVSFAGNNLSLVALSAGTSASGQPYTVYGASLAPYAGQTGQLDFTAFAATQPGQIELDDISFSTQAVPEPSPFVLSGIGGLLFALYRRFAPKLK